ncbi:unnamed protein product [Heligmosomoides polygyrus]|uniref:DOCKER domain-containing protein n=1 Tax=Heligmosomoides polygyrus TaxID=6339 RepID=A0A183FAU4_HELPZ|nr:unnamed protein product [Heligmosomoides polygyrus]
MQRKNSELMETALLVLLNRVHAVKKLSGEILGVVRPAVMGGISNYEVFFSDECSRVYDSEEKQLAMHLSALIIEQVEILEFCLYAHASRTEITKQFHDHLVEGFFEHKQYVEDKFGQTIHRHIKPKISRSSYRFHYAQHVDDVEKVFIAGGYELHVVFVLIVSSFVGFHCDSISFLQQTQVHMV